MTGAAGGPKWLVLSELDQFLFGDWLAERELPLPLVGSSSGSWRFAAASRQDAGAGIRLLEQHYIEQRYNVKPALSEVYEGALAVLQQVMGASGCEEVLAHPWARPHIVTARCRGLAARDSKAPLVTGMALAGLANTASRNALGLFMQREVFAHPDAQLAASGFPGFNTRIRKLSADNLLEALLASGSIPFVMPAVRVNGYDGHYRDGGLIDYHMDLPLAGEGPVLMPHFSRRIVSGWLDQFVPWRGTSHLDWTLVVHPSDEWIASLPNGKLPDRQDFYAYGEDFEGRVRVWRQAAHRGNELAACFAERVLRDDWGSVVEPL